MNEISIIGLDLAKNVFQVHGSGADGRVALRKKLSRGRLLEFFTNLPVCVVAMEACASAHYGGREIGKLGHEVRLINPSYVKPFVKRQKNDAADSGRSEVAQHQLRAELGRQQVIKDANVRLRRLYNAIEAGVADLGDNAFRQRIQTAKLEASEAETRIRILNERLAFSDIDIGPDRIQKFSTDIRKRLRDADPVFCRTWLHLFVDRLSSSPTA